MARKGGSRRNMRSRFTKNIKAKGKISLRRYLQEFKEGDKVHLALEPSMHKGSFMPKFGGKVGVVEGKEGSCYKIGIKDFDKKKTLVIHPIHLRKAK